MGYLCTTDRVCVAPVLATSCQSDAECAASGENFVCNPQRQCAQGTACQSDTECKNLGVDYAKYVCNPKGLCAQGLDCPNPTPGTSCSDLGAEYGDYVCGLQKQCVRGSTCTSSAQCPSSGLEYVCNPKGVCAPGFECGSNADCQNRGVGYKDYICNPQKRCDRIPACTTDANCTNLGPEFKSYACLGSTCALPSANVCSSNAQCTSQKGTPSICKTRGAPCTPLLSPECKDVYPTDANKGYLNQNALFYAAITNITNPQKSDFVLKSASQMGVDEIAKQAIGAAGGKRPIVAVYCDGGNSIEGLNRAVDHVIDDLGVPAMMLGSVKGEDIKNITVNKAVPKGVLVMTTDVNDATFEAVPDEGLMWRMIGEVEGLAPAYAPLLQITEAKIRQVRGLSNSDNIKVAMVATDASDIAIFVERIRSELRFNSGKSAAANGTNFLLRLVPNLNGNPTADFSADVTAIRNFSPDVVISVGSSEFDLNILPGLEDSWPPAATPTKPRPYYLTSAYANPCNLAAEVVKRSGLESRMVGIVDADPEDAGPLQTYIGNYKTAFPKATPQAPYFGTASYDSVYTLSFAFAANASQPVIRGANLAAALTKIGVGQRYDIGPSSVSQAFAALTSGNSISPYGASGPVVFDDKRSRKSFASVYCFNRYSYDKNGTTPTDTSDPVANVFRYRESDKSLSGATVATFTCYNDNSSLPRAGANVCE